MRASLQLALQVPRELIPTRTNSNSTAGLEQDRTSQSSLDEGGSQSTSSFQSIMRQYREPQSGDSNQPQEEENQQSSSPRQKSTSSLHSSQHAPKVLPQTTANVSGESQPKASALRRRSGTQSDDSNDSQQDATQSSDSKAKATDLVTDPNQTPQASPVLPLNSKITTSQDGTDSTDDNSDAQGTSDQPNDSKKQSSLKALTLAVSAPSRDALRMMASMPAPPSGIGLQPGTSSQSSAGAQPQAAISTPEGATTASENEPAPSSEIAEPERATPPPMFDVSSTTQPASTGPIALAAKLTPVETDPPATGAADTQPRAQIQLQKQGQALTSLIQDDVNAKPSTDPAPEQLTKVEAAFAPVAPPAANSTEVPKSTASASVSTAAQTVSQMEPLIETPAPAPGSNHDITIKVPDATERGMDVRFVERGGEVHVAIRTSDGEMAQTLRSGLNDFAGRMEHAGIRAEVWRPGADASSPQNSQDDARQQPGDQRGSRNQSGTQDRESDSQNSKKPRWVEAMENSIGNQTSETA